MEFQTVLSMLWFLYLCLLSSTASSQNIPNTDVCAPLNVTEECRNRSSCAFVSKLELYNDLHSHNCFCDDLCHFYGDCCEDIADGNRKSNLIQLEKELLICASTHLFGDIDDPVYLINKCPDEWKDDAIRDLCHSESRTDVFRTWPVADKNDIVYKNVYCAQCHGVLQSDVLYYGADISCGNHVDMANTSLAYISDLINRYQCWIKYKPFIYMKRPRVCKPNVIDTCANTTNLCLVEQCLKGSNAYVYALRNTYKNKACAVCNFEDDFMVEFLNCEEFTYDRVYSSFDSTGMVSLSLLLDMNGGTGTMVGQDGVKQVNKTVLQFESCDKGYVYDPFISSCRIVSCKVGYHYSKGVCVSSDNQRSNATDCIRHSYNQSEFHVFKNGEVYVNTTGEWYTEEEYHVLQSGNILVCSNLTQNYSYETFSSEYVKMFKFDKVQTVISIIGQIISIVCLTIHLIVYAILPALRNLAGKNLMCLVAALLGAQFLFLVGVGRTSNYGLCVFFAVIIHYGFLAAFTWMNVMSFDIWRTFSQTTKAASVESMSRRFKRYLMYGWLTPAGAVIIGIIVNFALPESSFRPGYGEGLCWITVRPGLIIYFATPVAILLLCNMLCFSLTAYNLHKISATTKIVHKNDSDKHRYVLYIKLSVLMGLTWIFGFIAALADVSPLWYVFVILNSLQGAFICFTFVFTHKVARLLREWRYSRGYGRQDSQTTSTMLSKSKSSTSENQSKTPAKTNML